MEIFDQTWPAPAKLNLMLRILGRRADGYHRLQSVFQFLDFGDELRFEPAGDGLVQPAYEIPGVAPEQDLVLRAANLLAPRAAAPCGVRIHLHKRLPMGGGLGGGSSDAATTLVALNRLWDCGLDTDALAELGLGLGADVPVFVRGRAAWAEGVGERLSPVTLPEPWYLVVVPDCEVSTAVVFGHPELTRDSPETTIPDFLAGETGNDCLSVVRGEYPPVATALDWLGAHGDARLTGTGACIFAEFAGRAEARAVLEKLPAGMRGFVARGLNRSPLLDRLEGG